jgi:hypothetical protein
VSVQRAAGASQAATAAADHELEPHGILFVHHGFIVFQNAELSQVDHIANWSIFTFPKLLIHASCNFSITVALYGGLKFSNIFDALVVLIHFSQKISFIAIGIHANSQLESDKPSLLIKLYDLILSSYLFILFIK